VLATSAGLENTHGHFGSNCVCTYVCVCRVCCVSCMLCIVCVVCACVRHVGACRTCVCCVDACMGCVLYVRLVVSNIDYDYNTVILLNSNTFLSMVCFSAENV